MRLLPGSLVEVQGKEGYKPTYQGVVLGRVEGSQDLWNVMIPYGDFVRISLYSENEMTFRGDGTHLLPRYQGVMHV